jgi:hypothetical protein
MSTKPRDDGDDPRVDAFIDLLAADVFTLDSFNAIPHAVPPSGARVLVSWSVSIHRDRIPAGLPSVLPLAAVGFELGIGSSAPFTGVRARVGSAEVEIFERSDCVLYAGIGARGGRQRSPLGMVTVDVLALEYPINALILKGTHNSYACRDQTPPFMNHPPHEQIDDFGVWLIELDFGLDRDTGELLIGHDGPGDGACVAPGDARWPEGLELRLWLEQLKQCRALQYRPVLLHLDPKQFGFPPVPDLAQTAAILVEDVFPGQVVRSTELQRDDGTYRTVRELAGKIVLPFFPTPALDPNAYRDECTAWQTVEQAIRSGTGMEQPCEFACRAFRLDQYQTDWTFDYGVPPNPLVVDAAALQNTRITDSTGDRWTCAFIDGSQEASHDELVGQHGTFRFPYSRLADAVTRAEGTTARATRDPHRAGYGWTVLMRPGRYRERVTVSTPLTLRNADAGTGAVIIG